MPRKYSDNRDEIPDYSTEPEVVFSSLSPERYCEFYDMEMAGFNGDLQFYLASLTRGMDVLEAGCGTGRLSRAFAAHGLRVTGIDISSEMLARAALQKSENLTYVRMDISKIALTERFDAAIVAHNTLNLLENQSQVERGLVCIRRHLKKNGLLLLQIYIPQKASLAGGRARTFQFQIFNTRNGGKIIKETLKSLSKGRRHIILEERYRVRPMTTTARNEDLALSMNLLALSYEEWIRLISNAGFTITEQYGDFELTPFTKGEDSMLLLKAEAKPVD
jgi:2-polyprenyl-3-methyl-5-hydroxy-6-metoxy-1,4-benzoquinol methylase